MAEKRDFYEVLGVSKDASADDIGYGGLDHVLASGG